MLNRIIIFFIGISLYATQLHAGPANPDQVTISQPDGSKLLTRLHGDEFQNWTEHLTSGHTIIRNKSNGFWEYAEQNADGTLKGSGIKVVPDGSNAPTNIKKGLIPPRNKAHAEQMNLMLKDIYQERLNAAKAAAMSDGTVSAAVGDWIPVPVSGPRKMLLILVGFADRALATTPASWNSLVFDTSAKSVAKYYKENSFNTLTITPVTTTQPGIPTGIISVTLDTNHPNTGGEYTFASDQAWGNAALSAAAPYVDYASLDTNGNGILEPSEVVIYSSVPTFS
ncbi:hypothetical protein [Trichlorobacter lovleyi]|uniref:hypothetical protein n=1 Tax=Trichlorobacter lovleyi TaxID=313985 RepID=UPI0024805D6A|nr:hypothetical protein [Trichlorobacter lovleyi]